MNTTLLRDPSEVRLDSLLGVWRRQTIRWPDGREDTSTAVYWLQGQRYYADVRIPAYRPTFHGINAADECTGEQKIWMANQEGFAGELVMEGNAFHWLRDIDYQPPQGGRDIGRLRYVDSSYDRIVEEGVEQRYVEVWDRVDRGQSTNGQALVMKLEPNGIERGWFIAVGDHFLIALDRRTSNRSCAFDMELSHGLRTGAASGWTISGSTFPWREGSTVFETKDLKINWNDKTLRQYLPNEQRVRDWQILEPAEGRLDWLCGN